MPLVKSHNSNSSSLLHLVTLRNTKLRYNMLRHMTLVNIVAFGFYDTNKLIPAETRPENVQRERGAARGWRSSPEPRQSRIPRAFVCCAKRRSHFCLRVQSVRRKWSTFHAWAETLFGISTVADPFSLYGGTNWSERDKHTRAHAHSAHWIYG